MQAARNILLVLLMALTWLAGPLCAADPNSPADPNRPADAGISRRDVLREGMSSLSSVTASDPARHAQADRLQQLIEQVRSLQLPAPAPTQPPVPQEPDPIRPPDAARTPPAPLLPPQPVAADPNQDPLLTALEQHPDRIVDPAAVAEQLYRDGDLRRAAACYALALAQTPRESGGARRAWMLYQMGNCLRRQNPTEAYEYYEQLVTEYPENPFTAAARAQQQIIAWAQQYKPDELLARYGHDPNSL